MNEKELGNGMDRRRRYRRIAIWSMLLMVSLAMVLPLGGYVYVGFQEANAQAVQETNPRANLWRAVRGGNAGYTSVKGQETGVLIQDGQNWRQIRNGYVANYGGWTLLAVLTVIVLYFLIKGSVPVEAGNSGVKIKRWNGFERFVHWGTAALFMILTITGLSMLFGRAVLIPLMGPKGFAAWADLAIGLHNYLGPVFAGFIVVMIAMWIRHNIPTASDMKWLKAGGGMFGKSHPDAGFANAGEKVWFWFICTAGLVVIASGLVLDFPNWGWTRDEMQLANLIHGVCSLAWICMWFGHAYLGTIGVKGVLEGMSSGYVDENWAKQHHNLWVAELKGTGDTASQGSVDTGASEVAKGSPA